MVVKSRRRLAEGQEADHLPRASTEEPLAAEGSIPTKTGAPTRHGVRKGTLLSFIALHVRSARSAPFVFFLVTRHVFVVRYLIEQRPVQLRNVRVYRKAFWASL